MITNTVKNVLNLLIIQKTDMGTKFLRKVSDLNMEEVVENTIYVLESKGKEIIHVNYQVIDTIEVKNSTVGAYYSVLIIYR